MFLRLKGEQDPNLRYVIKDLFDNKALDDPSYYEYLLKTDYYLKESLMLDSNHHALAGIYEENLDLACFYITLDEEEFKKAVDLLKQKKEFGNMMQKRIIHYRFHNIKFKKT